MRTLTHGAAPSDALVLFGVTGDLAYKMIFPALYAMAKRGVLNVPVVGVAYSQWSLARLRKRAEDSIKNLGRIDDQPAMRPLKAGDLVRGQYIGYRKEAGVARRSDVETFCALRLFIDSWRWEGVPWYVRSGKYLAGSAAEVIVQLKAPPQQLFADSAPLAGRTNYLRFRLSPNSAIALAARVKRVGKEFVGDMRELCLADERPQAQTPYERLLGDAMAGNGVLFTREDAVEAAWAVVDPVLKKHSRAVPYKRGTWGPKQANTLVAADGGWFNPRFDDAACDSRATGQARQRAR